MCECMKLHYKHVLPTPKLQVEITAWACPSSIHVMQRPDSKSKFYLRKTKLPQTENSMKIGKASKKTSETNLCISYKGSIPKNMFMLTQHLPSKRHYSLPSVGLQDFSSTANGFKRKCCTIQTPKRQD